MDSYERKFLEKVRKTEGCWLWTGSQNGYGYGLVKRDGRPRGAHRVYYELKMGKVPEGLVLDHLCGNRLCVRPDHMEPVTQGENLARSPLTIAGRHLRKTHCPKGHAYDEKNTQYFRPGQRHCRLCGMQRSRDWIAKRKRELARELESAAASAA